MIVAPETLQLAGVIVMATVAFSLYLLHTTLQESFKRRFHKVSAYGMLFTFGMLGAYLTFFYPRAIAEFMLLLSAGVEFCVLGIMVEWTRRKKKRRQNGSGV